MTANGETCWCGCGEPVKEGSAFLPGHDRRAEAAVIKLKYGSIQKFVEAHGYGHGGKNLAQELAESGRRDTIEKGG